MTKLDSPLVSIGLPVYNGAPYIREALDSLLKQTYSHLELIVSDNASTDGTDAICLEYAARDRRILYRRNPFDIGVYANFRLVLALASGDFFMWAGVDDLRPPNAVEECLKGLLRNRNAVLAHGPILAKVVGRGELIQVSNEFSASSSKATERIRNYTKGLSHNAILYCLYRRLAVVKGRLGSCYGQDYLFCLQMCLLGPLEYVGTPMVICRERKPVPNDSPMYAQTPVTLTNLLCASGLRRRKCWTVLLMGCYFLISVHQVNGLERLKAVIAHFWTFSLFYRKQLAKEVLFQLFEPAAKLSALCWRVAQHSPLSSRLAHKLQAILRV